MADHPIKKRSSWITLLIQLVPMSLLDFTWHNAMGIKFYAGVVFVLWHLTTCIVGELLILESIFLPIKKSYRYWFNIIGNCLFWIPVFYSALTVTLKLHNVTAICWISLALVIASFILQIHRLQKEEETG
jgi:hypothetical protein